jgi:hypothetical protein
MQIQALLMQFRQVNRLSFILAISPVQYVDFVKLCDHLEIVPTMQRHEILRLIHQTREMLLRENPAGIMLNKLDPLVPDDDDYTIFDRSLGYWWPWQIALCGLLNRPRLLKHALRRLCDAWPRVCGEVHFDDLISIASLRIGAPQAFAFLSERFPLFSPAMNSDDSRLADNAKTKFKEDLIAEWQRICATNRFDARAAAALLKDAYPMTTAATGVSAAHSVIRQSMQSKRRGDVYARRLFTEYLNPNEVRDQRILSLMNRCSTDPVAVRELAETITESKFASTAFEDFASAGQFDQTLPLLTQVYAVIRKRFGARADCDACPGFLEAWRPIDLNRPNDFEDWLCPELEKCIPGHLRLLTNIYHYWLGTSKHSFEERSCARRVILEGLRKAWGAIPSLSVAEGFDASYPYTLFHLVFTSDYPIPDSVPFGKLEDWLWSGPILVKASETSPDVLLPQILIALNAEEGRGRETPRYEFDQDRLKKWFGTQSKTILSMVAHGFAIHPEIPAQTKYLLEQAIEKAKAQVGRDGQ